MADDEQHEMRVVLDIWDEELHLVCTCGFDLRLPDTSLAGINSAAATHYWEDHA